MVLYRLGALAYVMFILYHMYYATEFTKLVKWLLVNLDKWEVSSTGVMNVFAIAGHFVSYR